MTNVRLRLLVGLALHALSYVAAAAVATAAVGSVTTMAFIVMLALIVLLELGPLRWLDRRTGLAAWRQRSSASSG